MIRIDVEVDFALNKGMATLLFYESDEDLEREPARIQRLYNLAMTCRKNKSLFSPSDQQLLRELAPDVSKSAILSKNLLVLPLSMRRWNTLRRAFSKDRKRFIERGSGQAYTAKLDKASIVFELTHGGKQTLLAAIVKTPRGTRPWCRVKDSIRQRREGNRIAVEAEIEGQLVELDLPIELDVLNQIFGKDNPRVPTEAIAKNLPALINHRLDLLGGPSVVRDERGSIGRLQLSSEGADVVIRPLAGDAPIHFGGKASGQRLVQKRDKFVLVSDRCSHFDELQQLVEALPVEERNSGQYVLKGEIANIKLLVEQLRKLPRELEISHDRELRFLLGRPPRLETHVEAVETRSWFELQVDCRVGNVALGADDIQRAVRAGSEGVFRSRSGEWFRVDENDLARAAELLDETRAVSERGPKFQAASALRKLQAWPNLKLRRSAQQLAEHVQQLEEPGEIPLDNAADEMLRCYQRTGAEFMFNRCCYQLGCLLADDMGLGKTFQVLTALNGLIMTKRVQRALVVCPASVLNVWKNEAHKFYPGLNVALLWGTPERRLQLLQNSETQLLVCTYAVLRNDIEQLQEAAFSILILDEAQQIKNPEAQVTIAAKRLEVDMRIALTGTPLENRLTDLWSINDFLNPGYLGTRDDFETSMAISWRRQQLPEQIAPVMLRRRKEEVAPELPPRTEETILVPLSDEQAAKYQEELGRARSKIAGKGSMAILAALTRLRQLCCDPRLLDADSDVQSAKLSSMLEMLQEIVDEGHSVLVFSQFTSMLDLIQDEIKDTGIPQFMLTGATPSKKRQQLVDDFNAEPEPAIFLLSLKAAGTGLTLSKADYVMIFDPWWNPAAENQAIDRTHRIGQDKPVVAYRFVVEGSIEEKVMALQDEKRKLFEETIESAEVSEARISAQELAALLE